MKKVVDSHVTLGLTMCLHEERRKGFARLER